MKLLESLTDQQIKALIKQGFMFKHKTLEERIAEYGGKLNLDGEYDWGEDKGREVLIKVGKRLASCKSL